MNNHKPKPRCLLCNNKGFHPNPEATEVIGTWNIHCECDRGQALKMLERGNKIRKPNKK